MRERRLANRHDEIADRRRVPGQAIRGPCAQHCEEPPRRRVPPGRRERHHQVRRQQRLCRIVDARLRLVGQFHPTLAGIDAQLVEAPEEGGGVSQVVELRRHRLGHRRIQVANVGVVTFKHRLAVTEIEQHQGLMPPQMVHEVIADRPVAGLRRQPVAALARPSFGAEDMRLDVMGEEVLRITLIRGVDRVFGGRGVAGLLVRESPDGLKTFIAGQTGCPRGCDPVGLLEDRLCLAMAKISDVADP